MAVLVGNAGAFKLSTNTVAEIQSWSLNIERGLDETNAFGDTWKEHTATIGAWSGTAQGRYDNTDTNGHVALNTAATGGTTVSARFYINSTVYYSGTAFVTASITANTNNTVDVTWNITGSGALSYT